MSPVILPDDIRDDVPREYWAWLDVHDRQFVAVCHKGCCGSCHDTLDEANAHHWLIERHCYNLHHP